MQENFQYKHLPLLSYTKTEEIKKLLKEVNAKSLKVLTKLPQTG